MNRKIRKTITAALMIASFSCIWAEENFFSDLFFEDFPSLGRSFTEEPLITGALVLGLGAAGYVMMKNDLYLSNEIKSRAGLTGDAVFGFFNEAGDGVNVLAGCGVLYAVGGEKEKKAAYDITRALAMTGMVIPVLKSVIGRDRPGVNSGPYMYRPFGSFDDSLPSGHTAVAFAWASVIADSYAADTGNLSYLVYAAAAATGIARVYYNKHWPSDVLAGAVLGILIGKAAAAPDEPANGLTVSPSGIGLSEAF